MSGIGGDTEHIHPQLPDPGQLGQQVAHPSGLRLNTVQGEKTLTLLGTEGQAIWIVATTQPAIVLGQIAVTSGETARREGQGHPPIDEQLGLQTCRTPLLHLRQRLRGKLEGHHPAPRTQGCQQIQRLLIVGMEMGTGNERDTRLGRHADRRHVVGLDRIGAVSDQFAHGAQLRFRLHQCKGGKIYLLSGLRQPLGQPQPVGAGEKAPFRTDRLAQIDHIHGQIGNFAVEMLHLFPWPEIEKGSQCQFHESRPFIFPIRSAIAMPCPEHPTYGYFLRLPDPAAPSMPPGACNCRDWRDRHRARCA